MHRPIRRHVILLLLSALLILLFITLHSRPTASTQRSYAHHQSLQAPAFDWAKKPEQYPLFSYEAVPASQKRLPRIQHKFGWGDGAQHTRREAVKDAFKRCWDAYREHAWMADELRPVSGSRRDHFGGWAATLVDSLDTLWIMGLKREFEEAVEATVSIDFSIVNLKNTISLFETTIRYLGGLLAAYDLSGERRLLVKAVELGHTLYGAFDTPNRMPRTHWDLLLAVNGTAPKQAADKQVILADIGSLTLEFTRLSQLTGDPRWYDAVTRIMGPFAKQQNNTTLPGMWPRFVNAKHQDFHSGSEYAIGALADSMYEYLVKMVALLGGSEMYESMYRSAMDTTIRNLLFRPMTPDQADILMAGKMRAAHGEPAAFRPEPEHLGCFIGGLFALGGRMLGNETHVTIGRKLTDGCIWAYDALPLGIMPEDLSMVACEDSLSCEWDQSKWYEGILSRLSPTRTLTNQPLSAGERSEARAAEIVESQKYPGGFTSMSNKHYILRPEAIESVFVLYRITGDPKLRDDAWRMFQAIQNATMTDIANSAISDVTNAEAPKMDEMESFWMAETLKYFYLIFSEPSLISLDEYVLNTEAHPLWRRKHSVWGWT